MAKSRQQSDSFFIREFSKFLTSTGNAALAFLFQKEMKMQSLYNRQDRNQLKEEILNELISRIHATVDVTEIVQQIDELNKAIERLGK